jgi:hypothetical protein
VEESCEKPGSGKCLIQICLACIPTNPYVSSHRAGSVAVKKWDKAERMSEFDTHLPSLANQECSFSKTGQMSKLMIAKKMG